MFQKKSSRSKLFFICMLSLFFSLPATTGYADSQPPASGSITIENNAAYTPLPTVSIFITATDDTEVTGYFLSETVTVPDLGSFISVTPTTALSKTVFFTLSANDSLKTVYAWFKDVAGNISNTSFASITLDENAPFNTNLLINSESGSVSSSQVTLKLSAEDTIGIIGYYVSESSDTPEKNQFNTIEATTALNMTISFTLSVMPGIKTLYTWFIDAAGNISSPVSKSVNFSYGWFTVFGTQDSEEVNGIEMDASGNTYIVGSTMGDLGGNENPSASNYSAFVAKVSSTGDVLWTKLVGTSDSARGNHIAVDNSGNVFIGGTYDEWVDFPGYVDAFLAKFDTNGNQQWLKIFKYDYSDSVERIKGIGTDNIGNIYIAGYTNESIEINDTTTVTYPSGSFLAKYDTNGINLWGYEIFPNDFPDIHDIAVTDSGNIFITGSAVTGLDNIPEIGFHDLILAKFDTDGVKQWTQLYGTPYIDVGSNLTLDNLGNIYVSGYTRGNLDTGIDSGEQPYSEGFLGKFNANGEKQWIKLFPSVGTNVYSGGMTIDNMSNIYIAGSHENISSTYSNWDMFIHKYNSIGTKIWTKNLNTDRIETAGGLIIGPGDLLYTTGSMNTVINDDGFAGQQYFGNSDAFVWKSTTDSLLDITLPTGTITINNGALTTLSQTTTLNLTAADNIGIAGYYISESSTHPSPSDFTYISETQNFEKNIEYTFQNNTKETKTLYAWYCDAFGNFSLPISADINFETETIAPVPGILTINDGEESTASTTLRLKVTATDNIGITGYYIAEGFETPSPDDFINISPTISYEGMFSYTLKNTNPGIISISIWFRDAAGNINTYENRATSEINLEDITPPSTTATPPPGYYEGPQMITLTCEDDYYCLYTRYSLDGSQPQTFYDTEFEITPPAILMVQSQDFKNVEQVQILTYGLSKTVSEPIPAGDVKTSIFEISSGSTLNIEFSLSENSIPLSVENTDCTTPVTLKKPDGSIHGSYEYSAGTLEILVAYPAEGIWSMEVDRSGCNASATYEAIVNQLPDYGHLPDSVSSMDIIKYLQILTGFKPVNIDTSNDVDNDNRIGPAEAIYLLQKFSNAR